MSDFTALATGLADGLNRYMQFDQANKARAQEDQNKNQMAIQLDKYKSDLAAQNQKLQQDNELNREKNLEAYKQTLGGQVSPDDASNIDPSYGDIASNFAATNKRNPTVHEMQGLISMTKTGQGVQMVDPSTLSNLAATMGADDTTVKQLGALTKPLPVGLAEQALKGTMDKGLSDSSLFSMYKDLNPEAAGKSPDQLGTDWQTFKTSFNEPGKTPIVTDQQFNSVLDGANNFVTNQVNQGVPRSTAIANAAQKVSVYDRKSKARLLFRLGASQGPSQPQQAAARALPQQQQ